MTTATFLIHPEFKRHARDAMRGAEACLDECAGLAHAIDLQLVGSAIAMIAEAKSSTLMGKGKVEELAEHIKACEAQLVVVNDHLSPVQQRNLEKAWECKVIDRTALILEIFGARARTHEGKLQVELAALNYQKSRLVRSWTHLERQRGGFGFLGGPGESQIEIDRRLIRDRIAKIKKQLEQVTRTRELHRKVRRETPYPVVALVGYTNAGKSTLFNRITGAGVLAMDKLFATLDPTMRGVTLPSGQKIILSDTVGFVSNLPTELVAAFRATLEEVLEADILLHVRDISHPDTLAQKRDVEAVLRGLFASDALPHNVVEVWNKIDLVPPTVGGRLGGGLACSNVSGLSVDAPTPTLPLMGRELGISALTGEGVEALCDFLSRELRRLHLQEVELTLPIANGKALAWLHAHASVTRQEVVDDEAFSVTVHITPENLARFRLL